MNATAPPRLSHTSVSEGTAAKAFYVLHGIFGSGRNWSSVMRRFVRARSQWVCRLIDLRQHGDSQGFAPPHTLTSAARDLANMAHQLGETPAAILGHSFGGKVALMYAREHGASLEQLWVVDSTPDARVPDGSAWRMLELLQMVPREFTSRTQLIELLTRAGVAMPTAQWMATNLEPANDRYRWRFDLAAIEQLLRDFFAQDLWDVVERSDGSTQIHFVKAEESSVLSREAVQRLEKMSGDGRVFLHHVPGGHWVNAENPDALLALLTRYL